LYFVGIDISKFKHDCAIIDELGDVITPSWSFQNDREGFSLLRELLDALEGEKKIGLESTGHYGQNLKLFLENNGFSFMEFNPLLVNRFVRSKSLRKTKTDSIDALMIAQYLMTVEYKPYPPSFYTLEKLKSLTRFRDSLIRQRSKQLVELTNVLDKVFPVVYSFPLHFTGENIQHEFQVL
jgi:transposase